MLVFVQILYNMLSKKSLKIPKR